MIDILQTIFRVHLKCIWFKFHLLFPKGYTNQWLRDHGNGLVSNRQEAFPWNNHRTTQCSVYYVHYRNLSLINAFWAPSHYPKRRLFVRSREVSKPRDWYFKLSHRFEIWLAHRQQCCRSASQISERSGNSKYKSRGFETLRDLRKRRLFGYWDGALHS